MYTSDLIKAVAAQADIKQTQAAEVIEAILDTIIKITKKGDDVRIQGFGTFTISKRSARTGRNPRTGATLKIPARKVPKFRAGKEFREAVGGK